MIIFKPWIIYNVDAFSTIWIDDEEPNKIKVLNKNGEDYQEIIFKNPFSTRMAMLSIADYMQKGERLLLLMETDDEPSALIMHNDLQTMIEKIDIDIDINEIIKNGTGLTN